MAKGRSGRKNKEQRVCQKRICRRSCRRTRSRRSRSWQRRSRRWSWTGPDWSRDSSAQRGEMGLALVCTRSSFLRGNESVKICKNNKILDSLLIESDAEHDAVPDELVMVIRYVPESPGFAE